MSQFLSHLAAHAATHCDSCGCSIVVSDELFLSYFNGAPERCPDCAATVDLWGLANVRLSREASVHRATAVGLIGGRELSHWFEMLPDQETTIDLTSLGVPSHAKILYVATTPDMGGVFPLEMTSNELRRPRTGTVLRLYGRGLTLGGRAPGKTRSCLWVTFVAPGDDEYEITNLANAFEAFLWNDFAGMAASAGVAVEDALKRAFATCASATGAPAAKIGREALLDSVLPLLARVAAMPRLPRELSDRVRGLWGLRDMVAHTGRLKVPVSLDQAADRLCAAIFACRYLRLLAQRICANAQ